MIAWLVQHRDALSLAWRRLVATPLATLLSVLAVGIALALPACGQMLLNNAMQLAGGNTPTPQISLFIELSAGKQGVQEIASRLRNNPAIKSIRFIAREDTLARMRTSEGLADVIDALPKNPFPDAFVVLPADDHPEAMEQLAAELRRLPKVEHVQLDSDWARRLDAVLKLARTSVILLALLLGVGLLAIVFNTIRLQVLTSRGEIEVSRLLGATDAFVRRPFQYFGLIQGLLGGLVAWSIVAAITFWLRNPVADLTQAYGLEFALQPLGAVDSVVLLATAATLGWLGASLSLRQYLSHA